MAPNQNRRTPTWQLWAIGVVGGLAFAVYVFVASGSGSEATARAEGFRKLGMGALFLAAAIAGGWRALRRR